MDPYSRMHWIDRMVHKGYDSSDINAVGMLIDWNHISDRDVSEAEKQRRIGIFDWIYWYVDTLCPK